jgi:hypothetical protein
LFRSDGIAAELTQELVKGRDYRLKFYAVKKRSGTHKIQVQFNTENDWVINTQSAIIQHTVEVTDNGGSNNDSWQEFTFDFSPPECGVDWIIIRLISGDVVFVDDFSLIDISPLEVVCTPIQGEFNPIFGTTHAGSLPLLFAISNIGNVRRASVEIFQMNGPLIKQWIVNARYGIAHPIYWNGKNAQGGEVSEGLYSYRVVLRGNPNICGDSIFVGTIQKTNTIFDGTILPQDYSEQYYNGNYNIPKPCCDNIFNYYIDNTYLDGPGEINIQIQNNIYVGTIGNVDAEPTADVILRAGNQIIIGPNFSTQQGAQVEFVIDPCASLLRTTEDSSSNEYTGVLINDSPSNEITQKQSKADSLITIFPNPSTGIFTLQRATDAKATVVVYDVLGNSCLSLNINEGEGIKQIDLTNFPKGIYHLQLLEGEKVYSQKIVIQ